MKASEFQLQQIAQEAIDRSAHGVRVWLGQGVNYREAILYLSGFHYDPGAEKFILDQATCGCGQLAVKFQPQPICGNCGFHEKMKQIEFSAVCDGFA